MGMRKPQGESLAYLFGGSKGSILRVRVDIFFGGWKGACCAQLFSVRVGFIWWVRESHIMGA